MFVFSRRYVLSLVMLPRLANAAGRLEEGWRAVRMAIAQRYVDVFLRAGSDALVKGRLGCSRLVVMVLVMASERWAELRYLCQRAGNAGQGREQA